LCRLPSWWKKTTRTARKAAAVLAALVALVGCGVRPEQPLIEQFFALSRLRDRTALQRFATVTFEPGDQGIVRTFQITDVAPEQQNRDIVSKQVTLSAPVELPDGRTVQKTIIVTMQRSLRPSSGSDPASVVSGVSRTDWTITGVAAFQPSPRL
jgi:hypothetical protein